MVLSKDEFNSPSQVDPILNVGKAIRPRRDSQNEADMLAKKCLHVDQTSTSVEVFSDRKGTSLALDPLG